MNFSDKLSRSIALHNSLLFVSLDPNPELMPDRYANSLDGLRNWMQDVIAATIESVCAYKPTIGFYEAIGAGGLELLEQTLSLIPPEIPVILDAKHNDLNTSTLLARTIFGKWKIDAITISAYAGQDLAAPFLLYAGKAVFVTCKTSNMSAIAIQQDSNLYLQIIKEARNWGTPEQVGLEVGTTAPEVMAKVRSIAPERLILARSIWANPDSLNDILAAGLNNNAEGLLIPIPQDWLASKQLNEQVRSLNQTINFVRESVRQSGSSCDLWLSNLPNSDSHPQQDLIVQLFDIGCILFGEFVQASGAVFPYYIDLRKIISNPQIFHQILNAYADILQNLQFDRIAGIPYGSLPTATGLALRLNRPMIFPRKEVKAHGTRRVIEGNFVPGETVVVVDDILISGKSAIEGAGKIESVGLNVEDIVVFLDHEQGVKDRLKASGYRAHSVLTLSEISTTLHRVGRISEEQYRSIAQSNH
ncbi:bifunctional orotidine-5'-phosphate decarboxylase/orotate phosphoribosyltransferase [Microcoleus sp. FACHB-1515]|uniref:bifunctional orotidine-5'-phosphate decarboxylase/orotate phosphoribosyltransferase n=1 Tax=Cyanophyceae TaxID=3028117 RepID=UPI001689F58C|nr:bifunctional orotidine-5'-phosphate decarboxylase/orotate phosphoribosyltransferase [Microcoleus sp. FACHB-1515]MBD2089983.1 bifunctional orotidine-5'-phosphate decarboxylase/orotate phosphoribosyltransferase [Microcoleus sp. FACHB-1515]